MSWAKLDDRFFSHPKVIDLSKDAKLLFLCGLTYCSAHLTDGRISRGAFRMVCAQVDVAESAADELINARLWESVDGGFYVHDYTDYNPTREQATHTKEARAEAGRKGGLRSSQAKGQAFASTVAQANGVANAQAESKQYPVPVPVTQNTDTPPTPHLGGEPVTDALSLSGAETAASLPARQDTDTGNGAAAEKQAATAGAAAASAAAAEESAAEEPAGEAIRPRRASRRREPVVLSEAQQRAFDKFWNRYPNKVGKQKALAAWARLDLDGALWSDICAGLKRWDASAQWQRGIVQHPSTWINGREWESEPMPAVSPESQQSHHGSPRAAYRDTAPVGYSRAFYRQLA